MNALLFNFLDGLILQYEFFDIDMLFCRTLMMTYELPITYLCFDTWIRIDDRENRKRSCNEDNVSK